MTFKKEYPGERFAGITRVFNVAWKTYFTIGGMILILSMFTATVL